MNDENYASIPSQRFLVWLTLILMVIFGVGLMVLMGFFPPPPADLAADQVAELYRANPVRFKIGTILGMLSGGCMIPLTVVISVQLARLEKGLPVWAITQALGGALNTTFFWLPMLIFATAAYTVERPPELLRLMHEFGWLTFITPLCAFQFQILPIIILAFTKDEDDRCSAFPRWVGYVNVWTLITACGGPIAVLFKSGVFSWGGLVPFYIPLALFSIWLPAMSYTCLRALRHQERDGRAGSAKAA